MKTHNIVKFMIVAILLTTFNPSFAVDTKPVVPATPTETPAEQVARLEHRLEEIKSMDHKSLSAAEKRALRKEVRAIKKEMAQISGGVYISVGALLLIILLILLLA
ncbi:hypothetical protein [Pseudochryseolinea flava]|uniref:Seryl-tRNA synthetase n=1 Tax=Pseudochryseolinea flava TaxID=2059302 RepID=A0A364Y6H9_9BACT|nr:hypothetical protein [Pseudochryseolinea flava]RAW02704.1 hypothetical protein DQQ10_00930 [Pseudochryseolinea flava]